VIHSYGPGLLWKNHSIIVSPHISYRSW